MRECRPDLCPLLPCLHADLRASPGMTTCLGNTHTQMAFGSYPPAHFNTNPCSILLVSVYPNISCFLGAMDGHSLVAVSLVE